MVFGDNRLPPRFWAKVRLDPNTGCLVWIGGRRDSRERYGAFNVGHGRVIRPHRHAYITLIGPIPEGMELDHYLYPGRCVGPECILHVRPVTHRENRLRGDCVAALNAAKDRCPYGHEYSRDARGRRCHTCVNERRRQKIAGEATEAKKEAHIAG